MDNDVAFRLEKKSKLKEVSDFTVKGGGFIQNGGYYSKCV